MTTSKVLTFPTVLSMIVAKKVASGAIQRVRHIVPQATLYRIYRFLTQKLFDYSNHTVWGNYGITLQNKSQKLQNRAARVLTFSNYDAHAGYLFELPLTSRTFKELRRFTNVYTSCPQTTYVLDLKNQKSRTVHDSTSHCCTLITTNIGLATVAPFYESAFLAT